MEATVSNVELSPPEAGNGSVLRARWQEFTAAMAAALGGEAFQAGSISAAVHCLALVTIGSFVFTKGETVTAPPIEARMEVLEALPPQPETMLLATATSSSAAGHGETSFALGIMGAGGAATGDEISPPVEVAIPGGGNGLGGHGGVSLNGDGLLKEFGEVKTEASFFGVKAQGRKFAFVVDTSGSMGEDDRWVRARAELERSLKELGYGQEYYVAFFNHQAFPMPNGRMTPARPVSLQQTLRWVYRAVPMGSTDPWPALSLALAQKPDAVFLLTDGLFSPETAERLSKMKTGDRVPIHTIGFAIHSVPPDIQTKIEEQLTFIARITNATYRFVP